MYQSRIQNKKNRSGRYQKKRDLEFPDETEGTYFGVVKDMLGNGRVRVFCEDGSMKVGRIRGSMRKSRGKTIIDKNDLVIIASREFEDKLDILHKYTADEVAQILRDYEIPEKIYKMLTESDFCKMEGTEDTIVFCEQAEKPATEASSSDDNTDDEDANDDNKNSKNTKNTDELDIDAI